MFRIPTVFSMSTCPTKTQLHFPASCTAGGGSMTQFWLMRCKQKLLNWASRKLFEREQARLAHAFFAICPPPPSCLEGRRNAGWRAAMLRLRSDKMTKDGQMERQRQSGSLMVLTNPEMPTSGLLTLMTRKITPLLVWVSQVFCYLQQVFC